MGLANSVAMQMAFKKYATSVITPGSEPVPATDPAVAGAQSLRRVGSTISPVKATFKSNEIRADKQIIDMRHGARSVTGNITAELSPLTFEKFYEAVIRSTWVAGQTATQATLTSIAADNPTSSLTIGASTWAAAGFRIGDTVRITGITGPNLGLNFTILSVAGAVATVYPAPTTATSQVTFTITVPGYKVQAPAAPVNTKWAFEHWYSDDSLSHLFTECRFASIKTSIPASGMATIDAKILGRNVVIGTSQFFTSPTAATTTALCTSFGGVLLIGGVTSGVITSAEITMDNQASIVDAAFNTVAPEIFTGALAVTGTFTALLQDNVLLTSFMNETAVTIIFQLTTSSATNTDFVTITLPKVKLTSANFANSGMQGVPVTFGFQALEIPATTGYDATTVVIHDSLSDGL